MKLNNLFNDFRPCFKSGEAVGSILGGGASLLNSFIGIRQNSYNAHLQQEMAADQMAWQTEEAEKARSFNTSERQAVQDYNTSEREAAQAYNTKMWNLENKYNLPVNQAGRLRAAGINPSIAMGQNGVSQVSAQSAASHGASSSSTSSPMPAQVQGLSPVQQPLGLDIKAIGSLISSLAGASKDSAEARRILKLTDSQLRQLQNDAEMKKVLTDGYNLDNMVKQADMPYRFKNAYYKSRSIQYEALNAYLDGDFKTAEIKLTEAKEVLAKSESSLNSAREQLTMLEIKSFDRNLDSIIAHRKSENAANYASAERDRASAALTRLEKTMRHNMQGAIEGEIFERWQNAAKEGKILDSQVSVAEAAAEQARYAADHKEVVFWKDLIVDVIDSGASLTSAFAHLRNAKAWVSMSESTQRNVERKIEQMQWEYGDKVQLEDKLPSGMKRTRTYRRKGAKFADK